MTVSNNTMLIVSHQGGQDPTLVHLLCRLCLNRYINICLIYISNIWSLFLKITLKLNTLRSGGDWVGFVLFM